MDQEFADNLRAVQALRTGLRAQAERPAFRPLNVAGLVAAAPHSGRAGRWIGLAAAVGAVAAAAAFILPGLGGDGIPAAPGPVSTPSGSSTPSVGEIAPSASAPATVTGSQPSTAVTDEPVPRPTALAPPQGFRWELYTTVDTGQFVQVAVPEGWGRWNSPDADYCFTESPLEVPDGPYYDDNHGTSQYHASACEPLADGQQALHVSVTDPSATDQSFPWDGGTPGWRQWATSVDGVTVTVTGREQDAALAAQILATVVVA